MFWLRKIIRNWLGIEYLADESFKQLREIEILEQRIAKLEKVNG